jgi:hypothetical protein
MGSIEPTAPLIASAHPQASCPGFKWEARRHAGRRARTDQTARRRVRVKPSRPTPSRASEGGLRGRHRRDHDAQVMARTAADRGEPARNGLRAQGFAWWLAVTVEQHSWRRGPVSRPLRHAAQKPSRPPGKSHSGHGRSMGGNPAGTKSLGEIESVDRPSEPTCVCSTAVRSGSQMRRSRDRSHAQAVGRAWRGPTI